MIAIKQFQPVDFLVEFQKEKHIISSVRVNLDPVLFEYTIMFNKVIAQCGFLCPNQH